MKQCGMSSLCFGLLGAVIAAANPHNFFRSYKSHEKKSPSPQVRQRERERRYGMPEKLTTERTGKRVWNARRNTSAEHLNGLSWCLTKSPGYG